MSLLLRKTGADIGRRAERHTRKTRGRSCPTARQYLSRSSTPSFTWLRPRESITKYLSHTNNYRYHPPNLLRVAYLTTALHIESRDKEILLEGPTYTSSIAASLCSCKHERSRQVCAALSYYSLLPWLKLPLGHSLRATPPSVFVPSLSIPKSAE
jgi:hypothetical protein